jgi:hypothetical protein
MLKDMEIKLEKDIAAIKEKYAQERAALEEAIKKKKQNPN